MATSLHSSTTAPGDLRISITTEYEVRYWTKALRCTETQLRAALASAGPMLSQVRKHLIHNA